MKYLIDTDWVVHWLHNRATIERKLMELEPEGLGLSIISLAELYEGVYYSTDPRGNEEALRKFLRRVRVLEIDEEICQIFARERGRLRRLGRLISDFDLLIGGTCLRHDLTLCTNNVKHFEAVENLRILTE